MHTHYFPEALARALGRRTTPPRIFEDDGRRFLQYGPFHQFPIEPELNDVENKLREMDAAGISVSVLTVNIPGLDGLDDEVALDVAVETNDELVELVRAHPGRFAALASLPMQIPDQAALELRRCVQIGLKGAMIYSNVAGKHLDDVSLRPVFDAAAELDVPLLLHPTFPLSAESVTGYDLISIAGFLFDTTAATLRLIFDGLFHRHPDFKLIVSHVGSVVPYIVGRIDYQSAARPGTRGSLTVEPSEHIRRLYVDTVCLWPPALRLALELLPPEQILFGTDHPFWAMQPSVDTVDSLDLPGDVRRSIEFGNAERLFRLDQPLP